MFVSRESPFWNVHPRLKISMFTQCYIAKLPNQPEPKKVKLLSRSCTTNYHHGFWTWAMVSSRITGSQSAAIQSNYMLVPERKYNGYLGNIFGISPSVSEVWVVVHDVLFNHVIRLREVRTQKRVSPRLHERVPCQKREKYSHFLNVNCHILITINVQGRIQDFPYLGINAVGGDINHNLPPRKKTHEIVEFCHWRIFMLLLETWPNNRLAAPFPASRKS